MKQTLEQNYLSVVAVLNDHKASSVNKIKKIHAILKRNFKNFEIVVVDNLSGSKHLAKLSEDNIRYTVINLPMKHGNQQALNAGMALAIGDYLVEIEDLAFDIDYEQIIDMYRKSQTGYDFVFLTPKTTKLSSKIFYSVLNRYFRNIFETDISSSVMILSSKRGQNKIAEVGKRVVNRSVAYVVSGLKSISIETDLSYKNSRSFSDNLVLMFDTLIYYTDAITILSQKIAFGFLWICAIGMVYGLVLKLANHAIEGWSSLFLLISFGFFGVFFILSIVIRYLHHILRSSLNSKDYIFSSVDKK